jgi:hypothetical protein
MLSSSRYALAIFLLLFVSINLAITPSPIPAAESYTDTGGPISRKLMMSIIDELASPEYEGRLTGQPGQIKAAEYIAGYFADSGLKPLGDKGGYFQYFTTPTNVIEADPQVELLIGDEAISYEIGEGYLFRGYTGSGDVTAPICFAGYGITDEYLGYDDYSGIDPTGKWVFCLRGWHPEYPDTTFDWSYTGWKARNAYERGAAGLLLATVHLNGTMGVPIGSYLYGLPVEEMYPDFPMVHLGRDFLMDLFDSQGWYLPSIMGMMKKGEPQGFDFPDNIQAHVQVEADFEAEARTVNVIGYIPGSDPGLASHAVIICGHHDHVGYQDTVMFPGSNDNASGTAALIAIAKAMQKSGVAPARSILFISFAGENIDYVINLDMIAQGTELMLWGGTDFIKSKMVFHKLCDEYEMPVKDLPPYPVSDHGPFVEQGIEAVMLLVGGKREYDMAHKPHEYKPELIDIDLLEKIATITLKAAEELAE